MAVGHVFAGMADPQVTGMEGGLSRARTGTSKNRSSEQTLLQSNDKYEAKPSRNIDSNANYDLLNFKSYF